MCDLELAERRCARYKCDGALAAAQLPGIASISASAPCGFWVTGSVFAVGAALSGELPHFRTFRHTLADCLIIMAMPSGISVFARCYFVCEEWVFSACKVVGGLVQSGCHAGSNKRTRPCDGRRRASQFFSFSLQHVSIAVFVRDTYIYSRLGVKKILKFY